MGIFFESRATIPLIRQVVEEALRKAPGQVTDPGAEAERTARKVAHQLGGLDPRPGSFVIAALILVAIAGAALWAETSSMPTATTQLWTAFQTILGVIVGFLGGEASGAAKQGS